MDEHGRPLPPCARSYYASLSQHDPDGATRLDVAPTNVVNDTSDPSLQYGARLLTAGTSLPMAEHGKFAYLLDTDGFTSAYKLQACRRTYSTPRSPISRTRSARPRHTSARGVCAVCADACALA